MRPRLGLSLIARLAQERRGVAAVELALIAPMILLLLAGAIDGSRYVIQAQQVRAAAQAGADYALRNGWDATKIASAVTGSTALATVQAKPAPNQLQGCVVAGVVTATGCTAGAAATGSFVVVNAQNAFKPLLPWPGLSFGATITAQAEARIK